MIDNAPLRDAAIRFGNFVGSWSTDVDPGSGLTRDEAEAISEHIDRVLTRHGPEVPPLFLVPEDYDLVSIAFDHLDALAAAWPEDRVDPVSKLTRADLGLLLSTRGEPSTEPEIGPPEIFDQGGGAG